MKDKIPLHNPDNNAVRSKLAVKRFVESMEMNYEKWHDGIGYDLSALDEMTPADLDSITDLLISSITEWSQKFNALDHIGTPKALAAVNAALKHPSLEVRITASRFAKGVDVEKENVLVEAIEKSGIYEGLSQALDEVESFHPPRIKDALLRGLLSRDADAVNIAGILLYIYGKTDSAFDWNMRPFFLRFGTVNALDRRKAFLELCSMIGIDPKKYLG